MKIKLGVGYYKISLDELALSYTKDRKYLNCYTYHTSKHNGKMPKHVFNVVRVCKSLNVGKPFYILIQSLYRIDYERFYSNL